MDYSSGKMRGCGFKIQEIQLVPLYFVHIPKTAGTSFRFGAERYFGKAGIVYDYGKDSGTTSKIVQKTLYGSTSDYWAFGRACAFEGTPMVAGHVGISQFVSLFGASNTITFIRNPLDRMVSEYQHFVSYYGYGGTFRDFYARPHMHNRQSKILQGVDIEAIGLVGLTERYHKSLQLINTRFGVEIPVRKDNLGGKGVNVPYQSSAEDTAEFNELNSSDLRLYQKAEALLQARLTTASKGFPWVHGRITDTNARGVAGWAWWEGEVDEPVKVEVWINGELSGTLPAVDPRPALCHLLPPRGGYVGFRLPLALAPDDRVRCRVATTGQSFL